MKDKRGQGISMEFIIIAALALIVLIVIILFFTGGLQKIWTSTRGTVDTATEQEKEMWTNECKLACSTGGQNPYFFCTHTFDVKNEKGEITESWVCNSATFKGVAKGTQKSLAVGCPEIDSKKCSTLPT